MATSASSASRAPSFTFPIFLTAYDPSDMPGGSVDPLGFERGYLFLANKILPGLTNVADRPRYFSVLCAGASLAEVQPHDPPRLQYQRRLECVLRFERFWALANVLASQQSGDGELPIYGIRGVTYAINKAESVLRSGKPRVDADFKLLSRQAPYGVVGIYGAVAEGMRLLDRKTFALTPDLGERLGEGFLEQTAVAPALAKAIREDGDLPLGKLAEWGNRAHISGELYPIERACMKDALHRNPVRSRMAAILADHPLLDAQDTELGRLQRLLPALNEDPANSDLREAVRAILAYEACYRWALLGFERLLWLCRAVPSAAISASDMNSDAVLQSVCAGLPSVFKEFNEKLETSTSDAFRLDLSRLEDTRRFLDVAAMACSSPSVLGQELLGRHSDVQRGKFDRGRRKMPWLELTAGRISLTMTRVGGLNREPTDLSQIVPHPYRLSSADSLFAAGEPA